MNTEINTKQIVQDLKAVTHDAEELIKATAGEVSEKARAARVRLAAALDSAKETCQQIEQQAIERAKAADKLIRENPYPSVGIAFGIGIIVGILAGRK